MDYYQSISRLLALVDHERNKSKGPRQKVIYDLGRMEMLMERLGNPQHRIPTVHIAGTKGKGSTAALCDSALHAAGLKTGFYSSPHLHTFRERIRSNSEPISQEIFRSLVEMLWPLHEELNANTNLGPLTIFEYLTGMAFQCFAGDNADVQVIEVGLGGRLDATNVLDAGVCVFTSVSLDHTAVLGNTIQEIAADKAGIIKHGSTVVVAPQLPEALAQILSACEEKNATPILVGQDITWKKTGSDSDGQRFTVSGIETEYDLHIPLLGSYQLENATLAVAALEALRSQGIEVAASAMKSGFEKVSWPCRMEILSRSPLLVVDGAHNVYSVESLLGSLPQYLAYDRLILVVGFSKDKDVEGMARVLGEKADLVYTTASRHPRSLSPTEVSGLFAETGQPVLEVPTPADALQLALKAARNGDLVLATGSLFVSAEVRESALGIEPEMYPELPVHGLSA